MIKRNLKQSGFTIVELLIVVVVIAILAAITIVSFNGIQNRAHDTAVRADLSDNGKSLQRIAATEGQLPINALNAGIKANKSSYLLSRNNFYFCINRTEGRFAIVGISRSGNTFQNVDGAISQSPAQYWGADTCNLIGGGTPWGGYDQSGGTFWQPWVAG